MIQSKRDGGGLSLSTLKASLSEKVFQGPKVVVNRFGWNFAQKLDVMKYFRSQFGSLLWLLVLELQGRVSFFAVWEPKVQPSRGHFESAIRPHFSTLCSQMNLTMNSTIIELSVYTWNFVLKVLNREEPGAGVWPKLMLKLQPQIAIFQNFRIFTCLLA